MMGKPSVRGIRDYFLHERSNVKRFRELSDEEKHAGIQCQWQQDSAAEEYWEQVQRCHGFTA